MLGQVFAAPVLPFIREVKRFPDEPGARHLTCQLFVQVQEAETTTPRKAGRCWFWRGVWARPSARFSQRNN